ncbi:ATP-binding protein [Streptomyces iconiensis]|uniref:ATP-binding protein n=1 Tax=Streptomyces iconiensis TaxID=1384038 RepID=A0ABT6ZUS5_9ACTN|nr:ATP-binding protein [Streptomyces iconiensis]MDJ1132612.1 ATP-binding protein [Streptomyces iconiensis]
MTENTRNTVDGQVGAGAIVQAGSIGAVHHHTHAAPAAPAGALLQLPVEAAYFEDRDRERARVERALGLREGRTGVVRPLVVAVSGVGGIGKSALGLRLAHDAHRERGCGALYVDLDDLRRDGAVSPADVLAVLLRALGVHEPWMESDLVGRARQYAARTAERVLVLVLDNVAYGSEVEPLLPVSADSVAIVISRARLEDLPGALEVPLGPLPGAAAEELLHAVLEGARPAGGPGTVSEVARLCGGLPAALHVAGRYLRKHRRRPPERLIAALRTELDEEGVPVVEAVWNAAYDELSAPAARLYRLLAVHPGPSFTPASAAALLGAEDPDTAYDALGELEAARLVAVWERDTAEAAPADTGSGAAGPGGTDPEVTRSGGTDSQVADDGDGAGERLRMHDLLRAHAQRRARREGEPGEAVEARRRVVRWYRRQAERADETIAGSRMRFATPVPALPYAPDVPFGSRGEAAYWMSAERGALYECVRLAHEAAGPEDDADAWGLCEPLWTHFMDHRHYADALDAFATGVAAAQRTEHLPAQARMRCQLARPLWEQGRIEEARAQVDRAVHVARSLENEPKLRASTLEFRGLLRSAEGDWAGAAEEFAASRRIHEEIGNTYGVLLQSYLLGKALIEQGEPESAAELLASAHGMAVERDRLSGARGPGRMTGRTACELARAVRVSGRSDPARLAALYDLALAAARARGADREEATTLRALADLADETGDPTAAGAHRARAHAIESRAGSLGGPEPRG